VLTQKQSGAPIVCNDGVTIAKEMESGRRWRHHGGGMAAPAFLGLLRKALPDSVRMHVAAEVRKDLVDEPPVTLPTHVPEEAFQELTAAQ